MEHFANYNNQQRRRRSTDDEKQSHANHKGYGGDNGFDNFTSQNTKQNKPRTQRNGHMFYKGPERPDQYSRNGDLHYYGKYSWKEDHFMPSSSREFHDTDDGEASDTSLDSTGKKKSFRRLIKRFAEKTSMQGVPYINNAKLCGAKLIWSILLLIAVGAMSLHLWYLMDQFYSWPINTKIELGYNNLQFPQLTICNTNIMHKGRFDRLENSEKLKALVDALNPRNLCPDQFSDSSYDSVTPTEPPLANYGTPTAPPYGGPPSKNYGGKRRKRYIDNYNSVNPAQYKPDYKDYREEEKLDKDDYEGARSTTAQLDELLTELYMDITKDNRAQIGHNISDMLLDCSFFGRVCDHRQFRLHQTSNYGNCWTLDSTKFNVQKSGPGGGISLLLYLETGEYQYGITQGYGIRVQIHEPESIPHPEEEGFFVPASMETSIGLRKIDIVRQGEPYGKCNDGVDFHKSYGYKYTRRSCQSMCELTRTIDKCGCFRDDSEEVSLIRNDTLKPCREPQEEKCLVEIERDFEKKVIVCNCENPCAETAYTRSMSSRQWPNDDYARVLLESVCESNDEGCGILRQEIGNQDGLNNNFLRLNVFYEDLNFETITETPEIELAQFMSDVGGAVGLWIGLSILSICELFQLMVELCDLAVHKTVKERRSDRKRRRKQTAKNGITNSNSDNRSKFSGNNHRITSIDRQWSNTVFPYENGDPFSGGMVRLPSRTYDHYDRPQSRDRRYSRSGY